MDHLQERLNQLAEQKQLTVPQTYENQILTAIKGHYDDIEDLINLQKALNNIQRLLTDQIDDGIDALMEIPKKKAPDLTLYQAWERIGNIDMEEREAALCKAYKEEGNLERGMQLKELYPEIFITKNYYS